MSIDPLELRPENRYAPKKGRLLISEPFLSDPYFRRTVVLLCEHNDEGSFGLVLNRYIDVGIKDLLNGFPDVGTRVSIGGPVQSGELFFLHTLGPHIEGGLPVVDTVQFGGDIDQLKDLITADHRLMKHVRFFVGYSGWSSGQLNAELEQRSWLVFLGDRRRIMNVGRTDAWGNTLRAMGRAYAPLANFPEDPTLN